MSQASNNPNDALVEISLGDAHYRDDSEIIPKEINCEYAQNNSIKGIHREFSLFDNIYLYCSVKLFNLKKFRSKQPSKHRIDLTYLDPKPLRTLHLAWRWLFWGMAAISVAALIIYVEKFLGLSFLHQAMLPTVILLGTFGFVLILLAYYKSYDIVVYRSYVGRVPLLVLSHKPRNKDYKEFISILEEKIVLAHRRNGMTMRDRLVGEMKDIRRLKDAGIVSEKEYTKAQTMIFAHDAYKT